MNVFTILFQGPNIIIMGATNVNHRQVMMVEGVLMTPVRPLLPVRPFDFVWDQQLSSVMRPPPLQEQMSLVTNVAPTARSRYHPYVRKDMTINEARSYFELVSKLNDLETRILRAKEKHEDEILAMKIRVQESKKKAYEAKRKYYEKKLELLTKN